MKDQPQKVDFSKKTQEFVTPNEEKTEDKLSWDGCFKCMAQTIHTVEDKEYGFEKTCNDCGSVSHTSVDPKLKP